MTPDREQVATHHDASWPWPVTLMIFRTRQRFSSDVRVLLGLEHLRIVVLPYGQRRMLRLWQ